MLLKLAQYFYKPKFEKLEKNIGCKLVFQKIPAGYIDGVINWDMTKTWKKFGLKISNGANHFTFGQIAEGSSLRFDQNASEYQSWFGGYTVKLVGDQKWTPEDHFRLAIADQNSWLRLYGDPDPVTNTNGWKLTEAGEITIGRHTGKLYNFGCNTHSDVGYGYRKIKLRIACFGMAVLFRLSNRNLKLSGYMLRPKNTIYPYLPLRLHGYIAIFDIAPNTKVVLYGNGVAHENSDTFTVLKDRILGAMRSCEITILDQ